jgi:short-subunit dehydrogenase
LKIVWITGGSSGIGFATAKKFLNNNWKVVISSRNAEKLSLAKEKILKSSRNQELYTYQCDISDRNQVIKTIEEITNNLGFIKLAILNAAAYSPNKSQDFIIENYNHLIKVNLNGTLYCIESLIKKMSGNNGHIAITSSPVGYRGLPTAGAYGLTKAGLTNIAESLYFDLKKNNIKISVINPGFIESESTNLNTFKMPFLRSAEFAGNKIFKGLTGPYKFEICFPWFFLLLLKIFRILPYRLYFYLIKKITKL